MLLPDPLKGMFGSRGGHADNGSPPRARTAPGGVVHGSTSPVTRSSRGVEEFFAHIRGKSGLSILDLGGANQKNVDFITSLGHSLYSEDFVRILQETFGLDGQSQSNPKDIERLLGQTLDFPEGHFDGVLVWDVLEYLAPALLTAVVDRLRHIVRPKSYLLAFFEADDKQEMVPSYGFRIESLSALEVLPHGARRPVQLYNNRGVEKMFGKFESVKFFLTKDRLREVIVKA